MRSSIDYTGRPSDWQPLADADPTPGDPDDIAALGSWCGTLANELEATANQLGQTCVDEFWKADAGLEFKHLMDSVAARCRQAAYRFRTAAEVYGKSANSGYSFALDGFQSTAWRALVQAQQARDDITSLARTNPEIGPPEPIVKAFVTNLFLPDMDTELLIPAVKDLGAELRQSRIMLNHVIADRDAAASQAAAKLDYVANNDGVSDKGTALQAGESVQTRLDAYKDAQQLAWALAHPEDPKAKAVIGQIADDLNRRADEPGFVTDIVNQSGTSLGGIASLLRGNPPPPLPSDPTLPLDEASQATLAAFGRALAATAKSDSLSPAALAQLTSSKDAWSTAMLLQYGPDGSAYGDGQGKVLLANLARNLTDELIHSKDANDLIFPPGQDAFAAILNRVSENTAAVRLALGDGSPEAKLLATNLATIAMAIPAQHLDQDFAGEQKAVAKFLASCGIPVNRADMEAMQGTLNIMTSFVDYQQENGGQLGDPVEKVLQGYTVNYLDDLSLDTVQDHRGLSLAPPPTVNITKDDLTSLLKLAYPDADSIRCYKTAVAAEVVTALGKYGRDPLGTHSPDYGDLTSLYGAVNRVEGDLRLDVASAKDAQSADRQLLINIITGVYGNSQLDSTSSKYGQPATALLGPLLPSWFDTGHVQQVQAELHGENISAERTMHLMVLQAFVDSGPPPAQLADLAPVLDNGQIQDNSDLEKIWGENEDRFTLGAGGPSLATIATNMLQEFGWQKDQ